MLSLIPPGALDHRAAHLQGAKVCLSFCPSICQSGPLRGGALARASGDTAAPVGSFLETGDAVGH